jgi:hypothetical protein
MSAQRREARRYARGLLNGSAPTMVVAVGRIEARIGGGQPHKYCRVLDGDVLVIGTSIELSCKRSLQGRVRFPTGGMAERPSPRAARRKVRVSRSGEMPGPTV